MGTTLEQIAERQGGGLAPMACKVLYQRLQHLQAAYMAAGRGGEADIVSDMTNRYRATGYLSPKQTVWVNAGFELYGV